MNIDTFIEYAKVLRKYRPILLEDNCCIDTYDDCLTLLLCDGYSEDIVMIERNKINCTPAELDECIKKVLIKDKKDEIVQKIKNLQEEQKKLEILLKTIDNAN